jgi:hypothetical protein
MFSVLLTYHVDCNFKFQFTDVQNAGVVNDNVQSLERCVCFVESICNIHNMTVLKNISALLTFLISKFGDWYRL